MIEPAVGILILVMIALWLSGKYETKLTRRSSLWTSRLATLALGVIRAALTFAGMFGLLALQPVGALTLVTIAIVVVQIVLHLGLAVRAAVRLTSTRPPDDDDTSGTPVDVVTATDRPGGGDFGWRPGQGYDRPPMRFTRHR